MIKKLLFASVIIPTYHDWDRLKLCIEALKRQTYPHESFEVIIVNNDPEDNPPALGLPDNFMLISEAKPGSYAARNSGIRRSQGTILAFTDSDCIPYPDWIENGVRHLQEGAERIAGRVELFYSGDRLTLAEKYEKAFELRQEHNAARETSVTANMVTWRHNFDKVGLFDDSILSCGDTEWGWQAARAGIDIIYAPDVVVKHPARRLLLDLLKKMRRIKGGYIQNKRPASVLGCLGLLARGFVPPVFAFMRIRERPDLAMNEKLSALIVCYFTKVYGAFQMVMMMLNFRKPTRV